RNPDVDARPSWNAVTVGSHARPLTRTADDVAADEVWRAAALQVVVVQPLDLRPVNRGLADERAIRRVADAAQLVGHNYRVGRGALDATRATELTGRRTRATTRQQMLARGGEEAQLPALLVEHYDAAVGHTSEPDDAREFVRGSARYGAHPDLRLAREPPRGRTRPRGAVVLDDLHARAVTDHRGRKFGGRPATAGQDRHDDSGRVSDGG